MNSSRKGSAFEREICKRLSLWFTSGKRDDVFWRTSGSGARATVRGNKQRETLNSYGDICGTHPLTQEFLKYITIEIKRGYNKAGIEDVIYGVDGGLCSFLDQLIKSCSDNITSNYMMLIYKPDRKPALVVHTLDMVFDTCCMRFNYGGFIFNVCLLDNLLCWNKPQDIASFCEHVSCEKLKYVPFS